MKKPSPQRTVAKDNASVPTQENSTRYGRLPFWKVQSIGNDFVLVHRDDVQVHPQAGNYEDFLPKLAALVCERRYGVGSDGLLVLAPHPDGLDLRMFNPDGTEDFCGNGLRCAAVHGHHLGWTGEEFKILHGGQAIQVSILGQGRVQTTLGPADYTPEKVPVRADSELFKTTVWNGMIDGQPLNVFGSALTTGSTHVVLPTAALPDDASFVSMSSAIEKDHRFPKHTSVIWVYEEAPEILKLRIWERGVGETQGCGTGSSAAAADYMRRRNRGGPIIVHNPGGTVTVQAESWDAPLLVEGVAEDVFAGEYLVPRDLK